MVSELRSRPYPHPCPISFPVPRLRRAIPRLQFSGMADRQVASRETRDELPRKNRSRDPGAGGRKWETATGLRWDEEREMSVVWERRRVSRRQYKGNKITTANNTGRLGPPPSASPYPLAFSVSPPRPRCLSSFSPPVSEDVQPRSILFAMWPCFV